METYAQKRRKRKSQPRLPLDTAEAIFLAVSFIYLGFIIGAAL